MCFSCKGNQEKPTSDFLINVPNSSPINKKEVNKENPELSKKKKDKALLLSKNLLSVSSRSNCSKRNNTTLNLPSMNPNERISPEDVTSKRKSYKNENSFLHKSKFLGLNY